MNYWSSYNIKYSVYEEIVNTANALIYAFSNPDMLSFKEQVKWLVELKIKLIKSGMCRFCNKDTKKCECSIKCSKCRTNHNGFNCQYNIMNSQLIKLIFESDNIKSQLG